MTLFNSTVDLLEMNKAGANEISMWKPVESAILGSALFARGVSGARHNRPGQSFTFCGKRLDNFGLHSSNLNIPTNYLVFAVAIG